MIDECFTIIDIPSDNNSQFASIGWYTNDSHETVRQNIIEELTLYKNKYLQLFKNVKILNPQPDSSLNLMYNNYINTIKHDNIPGDDITLFAAANFYNINICINETTKIFVDKVKPIDLYLESNNNHYNIKIKYENENNETYEEENDNNQYEEENDNNQYEETYEETDEEKYKDNKYITVFDDPLEYNVEHPLNDKWTLWVNNIDNPKSSNWLDTIIKIISVDSIEKFWYMYNNIPLPSKLIVPADFYLFKNDIIPMWEDTKNKDGGKLTIILKKNTYSDFLNSIWLNTILACIGNNFYEYENNTEFICGIVLNIRKHQDRINIWTSTSDENIINNIIYIWKQYIDIKINISFVKHNEQTDAKK